MDVRSHSLPFHSLSIKRVFEELASQEKGLSSADVLERRKQHGRNALPVKQGKTALSIFISQFSNILIIILLIAATISGLLGETLDSAAIFVIVILIAVFGFIQEYRAEKALESLKKLVAVHAIVLRDGVEHQIDKSDLVPGDVVLLMEGDRVPADCRLFDVSEIQIDESSLTGESVPVQKQGDGLLPEKAGISEQLNMAFMSTIVTHGKSKAIVTGIGLNTQIGRVAQLVSEAGETQTPLQRKLDVLGKQLGVIALVAVAIIFVFGILRGNDMLEMFVFSVSLAVAAIPEGLPAIVTITLAIGVQRMVKRHAIVRKMAAVEGLGAATIICSDKTGTLTKNEMTVRQLYTDGKTYSVTGEGYALNGIFQSAKKEKVSNPGNQFKHLIRTAILCNNAKLDERDGSVHVIGDPTEGCLLVLGQKAGMDYRHEQKSSKLVHEFPFDSRRKRMSVIYAENNSLISYAKGAPESILDICTHVITDGKKVPIELADKQRILKQNADFASDALRVLGFAFRSVTKQPSYSMKDVENGLTFLGLAAMNDPPRPEVRDAIALTRSAGIRVIMITGDNPETAKAIGKELGMLQKRSLVISGNDMDDMTDETLSEKVKDIAIFARVSPEHKMRIVTALQKRGEVVAMTGDGVNDAPAIKKADIGVAMGITGTEVAKEASDMVITDDNFASIVAATEEGRTIFDNIMKSVKYLVSCNIGEILTIFIAMLASIQMPLIALQILWMNFVTDALPALALGYDPPDPQVMKRPPRKKSDNVLTRDNIGGLLLIGFYMAIVALALFIYELHQGSSLEKARTMAFTTLVFSQLFLSFHFRSEIGGLFKVGLFSNRFIWGAFFVGAILQFAAVQLRVLEPVFKTVPLSAFEWISILLVAGSLLVILEFLKRVRKI
ncbi:calcium-transporting P-type ATPase, PMR1-type [Candidatus Micrarchaeota archaeon]|nr:calcium-transporting P-type ATPase, PMR1-type [Candidatus Micrarchaeota archaeon]